jgi:hypothetical protein
MGTWWEHQKKFKHLNPRPSNHKENHFCSNKEGLNIQDTLCVVYPTLYSGKIDLRVIDSWVVCNCYCNTYLGSTIIIAYF